MEEKIIEIINIIREKKNQERISKIESTNDLRSSFMFDSLDLAEFTVRIEKEFGIDIFEDGFVTTIGDVVQKLKNFRKHL